MHEVSIKFLQNINDKLFKVNTLLTLCITCVQYRGRGGGGYSTVGVFSTVEDIMMHVGISLVLWGIQYHGRYHNKCGDIFSTMGVCSTMGDIMSTVGDTILCILSTVWDIIICVEDIMSTVGVFSTMGILK